MKTKKIFEKNFFSDATILLVLNLLASALNYVYQILVANVLSVESFGTINTIFSAMLVVAVPGTTITMLAARYLAIGIEKKAYNSLEKFVKKLTLIVTGLGLLVLFLGICLRNVLSSFLRIEDSVILITAIIIFALGYYHPLYSGCMSGMKKFLPLGVYALLIPIYKLVGLAIATIFELEYYKLLFCLLVIVPGSIFTAIIGFFYIKRTLFGKEKAIQGDIEMPDKRQWIDSLILNIGLVLYTNVDILAARYIGGIEFSGIYSSVTLFGRIIYYGATSIGTVLLPMAATKNKEDAYVMLKKILLLVGSISILGLIVLNFVKVPLIRIVYGDTYLMAADYVIYVSLISLVIGLMTVMINFFVGIDYMKIPRNILLALIIAILLIVSVINCVTTAFILIGISGVLCVIWMFIQYKIYSK